MGVKKRERVCVCRCVGMFMFVCGGGGEEICKEEIKHARDMGPKAR